MKIGILGAARIGPSALIKPASAIVGVEVYAVAARDRAKAEQYAKENGIPNVFDNYEELLADTNLDAIYVPGPNGLHYEWAMKAIDAGKAVLLEKPSCSNADEARRLFEHAASKKAILLEALHHRFHPIVQKLRQIVQDGKLGEIHRIEAKFNLPPGTVPADDIRYVYKLAGGAIMDLGCYALSAMRFVTGTEPTVVSAVAQPAADPKVDKAMEVELRFPGKISASFSVDFCDDSLDQMLSPITVHGSQGKATLSNYVVIKADRKATLTLEIDGKTSTIDDLPDLGGSDSWSTYHYQLLAFFQKFRGDQPFYWINTKESIAQAEVIDAIYEKSGLGKRPSHQ